MASDGPHDEDGHLPLPDLKTLRLLRDGEKRPTKATGGKKRRAKRPIMRPEDRQYAAAAVRHWRRVHGLTQAQAAQRIGYSGITPAGWASWEKGRTMPPYGTLLRMLMASGLGHWTDEENIAGYDPTIRGDVLATKPVPRGYAGSPKDSSDRLLPD